MVQDIPGKPAMGPSFTVLAGHEYGWENGNHCHIVYPRTSVVPPLLKFSTVDTSLIYPRQRVLWRVRLYITIFL